MTQSTILAADSVNTALVTKANANFTELYEARGHAPLRSGWQMFPIAHAPQGAGATLTMVSGSYYCNIFKARAGDTFDNIAIEIITAADASLRVGMYAVGTTGLPTGAPLFQTAEIALTTGGQPASTTPYAFALAGTVPVNGSFWLVMHANAGLGLRRGAAQSIMSVQSLLPIAIGAASFSTTPSLVGLSQTGTYGALPSSFGAWTNTASVPLIAVRKT